MPDEELDVLVLSDEPISFRTGTAEVPGKFARRDQRLVMELAHFDGGGEGVFPIPYSLAHRYARSRGLTEIGWLVHAVTCANPHLRLRRILQNRGFVIEDVLGTGEVYRKVDAVGVTRGAR